MRFSIGHVLIKTNNFRDAVKDFEKLGFSVTFGGNSEKATNALIYFEDGSFLELYDAKMGKWIDSFMPLILKIVGLRDRIRADRYINYTSSAEGINEYALDSVPKSDYSNNMLVLKDAGYEISKSYSMKRTDIAGTEIHWDVTFPSDWRLPFFMNQYRPEIKRSKQEITHKNGVTGIKRLTIGVDDFSYFSSKYNQLFSESELQENGCIYRLGEKEIYLRKSNYYHIEEIWLKGDKEQLFDKALTHNAKIYITE